MNELETLFSKITTFVFDYDGVMTDGTVFSSPDGTPWRATNVKDGYALQLASKLGYKVAVISGAICPQSGRAGCFASQKSVGWFSSSAERTFSMMASRMREEREWTPKREQYSSMAASSLSLK